MKRNKVPHVALFIETSRSYGRDLLRGIIRYQREHRPWSIYFQPHALGDPPPSWLRQWRGNGILARVATNQLAKAIRQSGVPAVDFAAIPRSHGFPTVGISNEGVVRLAVDHLLDLGFRRLAFCGLARGQHGWMDHRQDLFVRYVQQAGYECSLFPAKRPRTGLGGWEAEQDQVAEWLRRLPKPVGVMACNDERGFQVLDACRRAALRVPDEVAVIGVDNDEFLCNLATPPLTSVRPNSRRVGYRAAELLDRLMAGRPAPPKPILLPPLGLIVRQSTAVVAVDDPDVAAALRYIRNHAGKRLTVADLLRVVPISRTMLERRMKKAIGRTPKAEILRVHLETFMALLRDTDLKQEEIAHKLGYQYPQHLSELFQKKFGESPSAYRRRFHG